jgi:hypothetical protein
MLLDWVQSVVLQVLGGCKTTADVEARMIEDVISVVMVLLSSAVCNGHCAVRINWCC